MSTDGRGSVLLADACAPAIREATCIHIQFAGTIEGSMF